MFPVVRVVAWVAATAVLLTPWPALAAPVLRAADGQVRFTSAVTCTVDLTLTIQGAPAVEHRLELPDGATVTRFEVSGATAGAMRDVGRTRAVTVTPSADGARYTLRYDVRQSDAQPHRCPLWLPTVPADGRSRAVHLVADVPPDTTVVGGMPAFAWQATHGEVTLAHLPAFVIVPFAAAGADRPWDVSRVMDVTAMATLVMASIAWLVRQKGRV